VAAGFPKFNQDKETLGLRKLHKFLTFALILGLAFPSLHMTHMVPNSIYPYPCKDDRKKKPPSKPKKGGILNRPEPQQALQIENNLMPHNKPACRNEKCPSWVTIK
jgi:hypothetical protein